MKLSTQHLLIISAIILCLFLSVYLFTLPAFSNIFNLSDSSTSNIGSTIGGITAPIIGLISSILLFITLNKQIDTIKKQDIKNENDLIFSLINQLHLEITYFYHTKTSKNIELKYSGIEAFHTFVQFLNSNEDFDKFNHSLYSFYQTKQILLFLRSFSLLEKKIEASIIDEQHKEVFLLKTKNIYECLFKRSLEILIKKIDKQEKMKDSAFYEIEEFYKNH